MIWIFLLYKAEWLEFRYLVKENLSDYSTSLGVINIKINGSKEKPHQN